VIKEKDMIKRLKEQNIERRKYQADMQRSYNIHNSAFMAEISLDDLDKLIAVCEAAKVACAAGGDDGEYFTIGINHGVALSKAIAVLEEA